MFRSVSVLCALLCLNTGIASAQVADPALAAGIPLSSPEPVVIREADGHVVVRATRISEPVVIDGELKEDHYTRVPRIDGFLQQEPEEGEPATEQTYVWLF